MGTKKYQRDRLIEAGLLFSLFYLPGYLFMTSASEFRDFNSILYNLQLWIMLTPQILTILFLIHRDGRLDFSSFGIVTPKKRDIPFVLAAVAGTAALVLMIRLLVGLLPEELMPEDQPWGLTDKLMILPIFFSAMLTGYSEEIFFRSYLYTRLENLDSGKWSRIILVNLVFAAGHLYDGLSGGLNAFLFGCYFSYLFTRKRNIHIPALIHGLYNFFALLLTLFL